MAAELAKWDFLFHTSDSNFSGMGIVEAYSEEAAREAVRKLITKKRPDVTVKEIRVVHYIEVLKLRRAGQ